MRVFIAEKPSLAQAIFEGLGGNPETDKKNGYYEQGNDVVTWCYGHMLELFDPQDYDSKYESWKFEDLPIKTHTDPSLKPKSATKKQLDIILGLIKKADSIVHAGDPDDEGCLLIDEILGFAKNTKPVMRLLVADLNLAPVKKALENMQPNENFQGMTKSALARSLADQSFGYNLTRGCTLKGREKGFDGVLNVGRVQTAVLGLVNERTLANQNHTESYYYNVHAVIDVNGHSVKAQYQPTEHDQIDEKKRIISEANAKNVAERTCDKSALVTLAMTKPENTKPPLPLNLSSLQQICAKQFGYSATKTLEIMQKLYETHKLLTYPRTDNRYLSDEHFYQANDLAQAVAKTLPSLADACLELDTSIKHKAFNASKIEAHHAIIPTNKDGSELSLSDEERNVYSLVAIHFIGLFYPDAIRDKTKVSFEISGDTFNANQSVLVQRGWEVLHRDSDKGEQSKPKDVDLSVLSFNDSGSCTQTDIEKKKTQPPKYFTEASLLSAMTRAAKFIDDDPELRKALEAKDEGGSDQGSIGTEATRAGILEKLSANSNLILIEKEKGYKELVWKTTKQGQEFCAALPNEIIKPNISAMWAEKQALIKSGEVTIEQFISEVDTYISDQISQLAENGINITANGISCPACNKGFLRKRSGNNGHFWACNQYPECKTTYPDKSGKPNMEKKKPATMSEHLCPNCEKPLVRRKGKPYKGKASYFYGCSGYPDCKTTLFEKNGKPNYDTKK
ncbi:DNA topoisomerase 3 (plasmid) [Photobacterium damselae subsp. damselae]